MDQLLFGRRSNARVNMNVSAIILVVLTLSCRCGHGQFLFPGLRGNAQQLRESLAHQPLLSAARVAGESLVSTFNVFSEIPLSLLRLTGISNLPNLFNNRNIVGQTDSLVAEFNSGSKNEDITLNVTELITKYGKSAEEHAVVTGDGYVLKMIRIPGDGPVVFLMHGVLGSADDFVVAGPQTGMAYLLSEAGYDVWMGNARGNKHSRRHIKLSPMEAAFWDFSWHEIGVYDLPVFIDYILDLTGKTQLSYIGHSQGTTVFFVMASELPEYNDKITLMVALSPVAYMTHVKSPVVRILASGHPILHSFSKSVGLHEFLPDNKLMKNIRQLMCGQGPLAEILCSNALFMIGGFGLDQLDVKNLPVVYGHTPSGSSMKQFVHYGQEVVSKEFRKFDYGVNENLEIYGSSAPPRYNVHKISAPVSLFYSSADWLAQPEDVDKLYNQLGNCVDIHKIPHPQFNHIDFIHAKDFKKLVFKRLMKLLKKFNP